MHCHRCWNRGGGHPCNVETAGVKGWCRPNNIFWPFLLTKWYDEADALDIRECLWITSFLAKITSENFPSIVDWEAYCSAALCSVHLQWLHCATGESANVHLTLLTTVFILSAEQFHSGLNQPKNLKLVNTLHTKYLIITLNRISKTTRHKGVKNLCSALRNLDLLHSSFCDKMGFTVLLRRLANMNIFMSTSV